MMRTDAGLHADQARGHVGKVCFDLATRPLLPQRNCAWLIQADNVERVLADIDADHGDRGVELLRHVVLLVFGAPCQLPSRAGQEHARTIPLTDLRTRGATSIAHLRRSLRHRPSLASSSSSGCVALA